MEFNFDRQKQDSCDASAATAYRQLHGRSLMALSKLRGAVPENDELCRIRSVETLPPTLWITVTFLNGTTKSFRPENIRRATTDEERTSERTAALANGAV
jgi:hypothetical protein